MHFLSCPSSPHYFTFILRALRLRIRVRIQQTSRALQIYVDVLRLIHNVLLVLVQIGIKVTGEKQFLGNIWNYEKTLLRR